MNKLARLRNALATEKYAEVFTLYAEGDKDFKQYAESHADDHLMSYIKEGMSVIDGVYADVGTFVGDLMTAREKHEFLHLFVSSFFNEYRFCVSPKLLELAEEACIAKREWIEQEDYESRVNLDIYRRIFRETVSPGFNKKMQTWKDVHTLLQRMFYINQIVEAITHIEHAMNRIMETAGIDIEKRRDFFRRMYVLAASIHAEFGYKGRSLTLEVDYSLSVEGCDDKISMHDIPESITSYGEAREWIIEELERRFHEETGYAANVEDKYLDEDQLRVFLKRRQLRRENEKDLQNAS